MYSFEKINEDTYKLKTESKEFTFTRTVDLAKELQKVDLYTTSYLADILEERGETFENTKLKVERSENGKIIVDETNFNTLKESCRSMAWYDVLDRVFKKTIGLGYIEILQETGIGLKNLEEIEKFCSEFSSILVNGMQDNTPREQNT